MPNNTMDSTTWALWVSNDMEYGDHSNTEIVGEWGDKECKEFCQDYINSIVSVNGLNGLSGTELMMIQQLNLSKGGDDAKV